MRHSLNKTNRRYDLLLESLTLDESLLLLSALDAVNHTTFFRAFRENRG